jgi:septum formation protein
MMRLILASTSPRRREILSLLGVPFEAIDPPFEEIISESLPIDQEVFEFAAGKALSVAATHRDAIVIGSDTMISIDGEKLGKPKDVAEAKRMLRELGGKSHRIYTAVAIVDGAGGQGLRGIEEVSVRMRAYSEQEIEDYIACGESLDKAGAYSIQGEGSRLIESIDGDYLAAVGLPLRPIAGYLKSRRIDIAVDVDGLYEERTYRNWSRF